MDCQHDFRGRLGGKCVHCGKTWRELTEERAMHYRNGREAKNGDKVIQLSDARYGELRITAVGILYDAKPGNDHCNGNIAPTNGGLATGACLCDCLHMEDLAAVLGEKGLDKRPEGK